MSRTNADEKNNAANRDVTTRDTDDTAAKHAISDGGEDTQGALELEYPANRGLYREVFERYDPEIADLLIDTRAVRFVVELEFNLCRSLALLAQLPVDARVLDSIAAARREIEIVLWATCDALAEDWLDGESASNWAGSQWTSGSELL